jgi:hypothetical protein
MARYLVSNLLGLVGAVLGAVVGFYTFTWLKGHGFYGLMIPGAFLGLGCGLAAQHPSIPRGIVCGIAALLLALFTEWWYWPFEQDNRYLFLVMHFTELSPVTLLMTGLGAVIAFWVGKDAGFRKLPDVRRPVPVETASEPRRKAEG